MAVFGRSRKSADDEEFVSLEDEDHAWWASRDDLERPWTPPRRDGDEIPVHDLRADGQPRSNFEAEFSAESLFNWADGTDTNAESRMYEGAPPPLVVTDGSDPYGVLGVDRDATWDEIVAAHRQLAKLHHPDRLVDIPEKERVASEQTMRMVNAAYLQLRRHHTR